MEWCRYSDLDIKALISVGRLAHSAVDFVMGSDMICDPDGGRPRGTTMKADTHPQYENVTATCSCGNVIQTKSTLCKDISIEVCSQCHPFYTGKQKTIDSAGRIDRFNKRFRRGAANAEASRS